MFMDDGTFVLITLFVPTITESLRRINECLKYERTKKYAIEAGYEDVKKYVLDHHMKNPKYPARRYLECVSEYGVGSTMCNKDKGLWLELKSAEIGNKVAWDEEEAHKMLKEDAIAVGYKEGYFLKKDPRYLKYAAQEYEKCIAERGVGAENTLCKHHKKVWLDAKALQDGNGNLSDFSY